MSARRKAIPKKLRFEVFKRDRFTCQYCGAKAPDVILQVDHIKSLAEGGTDDFLNLIAACEPCNNGKGARRLEVSDEVTRVREQAEALQERREQIAMMAEWREELMRLGDLEVDTICDFIAGMGKYRPNENGKITLRKHIKKYGFEETLASVEIAFSNYYLGRRVTEDEGEAWETAFNKVGGVLNVRQREKETPGRKRLYYIRAILKDRMEYQCDWMKLLLPAFEAGAPVEELERAAKTARNWSEFKREVGRLTSAAEAG